MKKFLLYLLLVLVVFMIVGCDFNKAKRLPEQKNWAAYNNLNDNGSVAQVKEYILKIAKRPSSVEFIQWSQIRYFNRYETARILGGTVTDTVGWNEPHMFYGYVEFSAMNGFGGYSRSTYCYFLFSDGEVISFLTHEVDDYDWDNYFDKELLNKLNP